MSDEINEGLGVVTPGLDDGRKLAREEIQRIIRRHVVLRLSRIRLDVEKLGNDRRRLQPLANDEEKTHDATDLMPQETGSDYAQLAQLNK